MLLHVVDLQSFLVAPDIAGGVPVPLTNELRDSILRAAEQRFHKALRAQELKGKVTVVSGAPTSAILDEAGRLQAKLLVVGTTGATGLKRMVLGSVAEAVVRAAPCSTLVVRMYARPDRAAHSLEKEGVVAMRAFVLLMVFAAPMAVAGQEPPSPQSLFEAGAFEQVLTGHPAAEPSASPDVIYLRAQSFIRLNRQEEARAELGKLLRRCHRTDALVARWGVGGCNARRESCPCR